MAKIERSFDPADVGFDPRDQGTPVVLDGGPLDDYVVTYTTRAGIAGERRTARGKRRFVVGMLMLAGYKVQS